MDLSALREEWANFKPTGDLDGFRTWFAPVAFDIGGQEGPLSDVVNQLRLVFAEADRGHRTVAELFVLVDVLLGPAIQWVGQQPVPDSGPGGGGDVTQPLVGAGIQV